MTTSDINTRPRALSAAAAGHYLAELIGLPAAITARRVWSLERDGSLKSIRVGRRVFFRDVDLREFVDQGGCATHMNNTGSIATTPARGVVR